MNLQIGDLVTAEDSGDKQYKVVHIKQVPGPDGFIYLCEADGVRIQRYAKQLKKVE
jgi:hypothetical protein